MPDNNNSITSDKVASNLQDVIANSIFGFSSYKAADSAGKVEISNFLNDFFAIVGNLDTVIANVQNNIVTADQMRVLNTLVQNPSIKDEFLLNYIQIITKHVTADNIFAPVTGVSPDIAINIGDKLNFLIDQVFKGYLDKYNVSVQQGQVDTSDYIQQQFAKFSIDPHNPYVPYFDFIDDYNKKIRDEFLLRDGKFRNDTPPAYPEPYRCRIGAATFMVPPTNIQVSQVFKATSLGGVLRQQNSPKSNLGYSETQISMTLYFPNHESIWGFVGNKANFNIFDWDPSPAIDPDSLDIYGQKERASNAAVSDATIDYFLSSLRGLIVQFKYAPFLPIRNQYLNSTYDINAVALQGMTINTIPNFPFAVAVNLQMCKFNYNPFLPMIEDFDQAIHWGKFRQHMGRAAARLDAQVNQGFLKERPTDPVPTTNADGTTKGQSTVETLQTYYEGDLIPRLDKIADIQDGRNFDFFYPISTPSRIFAPDTTDFRQPGEDQAPLTGEEWSGFLGTLGYTPVSTPQFNFFQFDTTYRNSSIRNERRVLRDWLHSNQVAFAQMQPDKENKFVDDIIAEGKKNNVVNANNEASIRTTLHQEWFYMIYELLLNDNPLFKRIRESRSYQNSKYVLDEWKVPMEKMYVDWGSCFVQSVNVSLSNNFAKLQIQLQDEPTYQHIGGGDSQVNVNMVVIGESNLQRFRQLFEHVNGLARLEKVHGVLGFLGIKNIITALSGIKYVLPLAFEVDTMPGYPHVYNVSMSFIDFDVMQQQREKLSTAQQKEFIDTFGSKRNPFLRLKQAWSTFSAYPDMPLDVKDTDGKILGHFDPDWYFRSFNTTNSDSDLFNWGFDTKILSLVKQFTDLKNLQQQATTSPVTRANLPDSIADIERQIREAVNNGGQLPPGWTVTDGAVTAITAQTDPSKRGEPDHIQYLGMFNDNDSMKISYIAFYAAGYFTVGEEDAKTGERTENLALSVFSEDVATKNLAKVAPVSGAVSSSQYQHEYVNGADNPNKQFEAMMQDFGYRTLRGRMLKAFPTYMLWLIDEGGRFAGIKLFDNVYGLNSVVDFSVLQSEDPLSDTLVLRLSNIYQRLTTPYKDQLITEDDPLFDTPVGKAITVLQNRDRNLRSGLTNDIIELNSIRLKPGVRVHLRMGYGSNPNSLQTVFNGVIAEVEQGDIMTITAQSDAVEFTSMVNTVNQKGNTGTLQGGIDTGFWLSEPRDLIVRLLSMGTSNFKEWVSWGSKGVLFSDSRFGIRHFGTILYEEMTHNARLGVQNRVRAAGGNLVNISAEDETGSAAAFTAALGSYTNNVKDITSISQMTSLFNGSLIQIGQALWLNSFASRDYEVFKRNIYPGNGLGIAQFMGGDMIDAGITVTSATTFYAKNSDGSAYGAKDPGGLTRLEPTQAADQSINEADIDYFKNNYNSINGISDDALLALMVHANTTSPDFRGSLDNLLGKGDTGLLGQLFEGIGEFADSVTGVGSGLVSVLKSVLSVIPGAAPIVNLAAGGANIALDLLDDAFHPASSFKRLINSPMGKVMGLTSEVKDDDLPGYNEVSFRAQTYMKTVWDLFKTCAALLPNYIVAVRPFEDRSTLFYGKPHWLYTSGVIPVTLGVPTDNQLNGKDASKPGLEGPDFQWQSLLDQAKKNTSQSFDKLQSLSDSTDSLKNIMSYNKDSTQDPYDANVGIQPTTFSSKEDIPKLIEHFTGNMNNNHFKTNESDTQLFNAFQNATDLTGLTPDQIEQFIGKLFIIINEPVGGTDLTDLDGRSDRYFTENGNDFYRTDQNQYVNDLVDAVKSAADNTQEREDVIKAIKKHKLSDLQFSYLVSTLNTWGKNKNTNVSTKAGDAGDLNASLDGTLVLENGTYNNDTNNSLILQYINSFAKTEQERTRLLDFYKRDPITFANQFGWKFNAVPVYFSPTDGFGYDKVGTLARQAYDDDFSPAVAGLSNKSVGIANNIWAKLRNEFRTSQTEVDVFKRLYPTATDKYDEFMDLFLRFLWQDPFNRAWPVIVAARTDNGYFDSFASWNFGGKTFNLSMVTQAWEIFLSSGDISINPTTNIITSPAARRFMETNKSAGTNKDTFFSAKVEQVSSWFDDNIGQLVGLITDTISGFVDSIRLSLSQVGNGLAQAAKMQVQANTLNSILNDSIYYQEGEEGSILRLVDNPFTREYGEPVIEIREPFQRLHYISSFDSIIDNQVTENLDKVATVVTAVSDGAHPVTVHFDKGIAPDRQIEKTVETGLYWDNTYGSGLFGFLQPLLHPLETLRGYSKLTTGSSDELSSRRIALAHLKESLEDLYMGEVTIVGSADVRPFDLVYMADVSERMYGLFQVEQVIHHFTPESGFVTAITPNALVTVNDPARWTMLSWLWQKMTSYNLRDDVRATMAVKADRAAAAATKSIGDDDLYKYFGTQLNGAVQWTQGNSAIVRDIGAVFAGGGIQGLTAQDKAINAAGTVDIALGLTKSFAAPVGAIAGGLLGGGPGGAFIGAAAAWSVSDLLWQGWQWVKDNLLDQHGCYIQYLNKDGQPMDAGLSYFQGVAVGTNHTVQAFPAIMGIPTTRANIKPDGHFRITTDDLLQSLGWTEVETLSLYRDTSIFVNNINAKILQLAGRRDPITITDENTIIIKAKVLDPYGEVTGTKDYQGLDNMANGVEDGDTINVKILESSGNYTAGQVVKIRLAVVNTYELYTHNNPYSPENEVLTHNPSNDLGRLATQYLAGRFQRDIDRYVAIRIDKNNQFDSYESFDKNGKVVKDGRTIGLVFANAPLGTADSDRLAALAALAGRNPAIPFDSYMNDGRPYTINWEMIMTGFGNVDMRETLFNTGWRNDAVDYLTGVQ